jgi:sugar fermentation stimulation protein A
MMQCLEEYVLALFLRRPNRFLAEVQLLETNVQDQQTVLAHVPDPGRLKELLTPSAKVILTKNDNPARKTRYSLVGVKKDSMWVNIDSILTNRLFKEDYLQLDRYKDFTLLKSEFTYKTSRFDFLMQNRINSRKTIIEIKSATLVKKRIAMFPDAPTIRGAKHVEELITALDKGYDAEIIFITKRRDADKFTVNKELDPNFYKVLKRAKKAGVLLVAVVCDYDPIVKKELKILHEIPVFGV